MIYVKVDGDNITTIESETIVYNTNEMLVSDAAKYSEKTGVYETNTEGIDGTVFSWKYDEDGVTIIPDQVLPEYWITKEELEKIGFYNIEPTDLIFCIQIGSVKALKKITKNQTGGVFSTIAASNLTPSKNDNGVLYAFYKTLNKTDDEFDLDDNENIENPYSDICIVTSLTTNLEIITDDDGDEIIQEANE